MRLYSVITTYHLLCAVVHCLLSKDDNENVLLLPLSKVDIIHDYSIFCDIFNSIILINTNYSRTNNDDSGIGTIAYINNLLSQNNISIHECQEIHVWGSQYAFGYYLALQSIPFIFWEEACGILSRPEILENIDSKLCEHGLHCALKNYGLYDGTNPCITKRVCNLKAQTEGFSSDNLENFDVIEGLLKLKPGLRNSVMSLFTCKTDKIPIPEHSVMFLTQHFANLRIMTLEEQILIYQTVIDYFFQGRNVVFKPHPEDILYYSLLFPESQVIHERFPSEFLPLIFDNKPDEVATISSTGIWNLRNHFDHSFELGFSFEKDFKAIHRYYTAVKAAIPLLKSGRVVVCAGANEILVRRLLDTVDLDGKDISVITPDKYDGKSPSVWIADSGELPPKNSSAFFLNSQKDYAFYDHYPIQRDLPLVPIVIEKQRRDLESEDFYADIEPEIIYFTSQNKEEINHMKETAFEKELTHVGINLNITSLTPEERRIKILEGMLEATEKRLLVYIKRVSELEMKNTRGA